MLLTCSIWTDEIICNSFNDIILKIIIFKFLQHYNIYIEIIGFRGFYIVVVTIASFATLKDCWQSWTDVANTELQSGKDEAPAVEQKDGIVSDTLSHLFNI